MKLCKDVNIENSRTHDWAEPDVIHDFNGVESDPPLYYNICTHCNARKMHGVNYPYEE